MPGASSQHSRSERSRAFQNARPGRSRARVARQHESVRRDDDETASPAAHARLRATREVVRQHPLQLGPLRADRSSATICDAVSSCSRDGSSASRLRSAKPSYCALASSRRSASSARASAISAATFARLSRCSTTLSVSASPRRALRARLRACARSSAYRRSRRTPRGRVLDRELHAAQAGVAQRREPVRAERDAGRDEVRIELRRPRRADDRGEIASRRRLAAGEADVHGAERGGFAEHAAPGVGVERVANCREILRVRAVRTAQRAAIRQLGDQVPDARCVSHRGR